VHRESILNDFEKSVQGHVDQSVASLHGAMQRCQRRACDARFKMFVYLKLCAPASASALCLAMYSTLSANALAASLSSAAVL
jgi:hypothetical protein